MDLSQQYVYRVYLEKSFTLAANALFVSQPALSAMVSKLEKKIGFRIFDRSNHDLTLTPSGRIYIEYLENVMREENLMREKIWKISNANATSLTVSGGCQTAYFLLPAVCSEFSRLNPNISITVNVGNNSSMRDLTEALKSDRIDILLTYGPRENGCAYFPIYQDRLLIAVHKKLCSPKALSMSVTREEILSDIYPKRKELEDLSCLEGIPFLQREAEVSTDFIFSKLFKSPLSISPIRVSNAKNLAMHYNFLREGILATLVFDSHLPQHFFDDPNIIYFIPKSKSAYRTLYFAVKEAKKDDPTLKNFISIAKGISHIYGLKNENFIRD